MFKILEKYISENSNKVIAIDGPSGAGKSSLAKRLETSFDVLVIHTDDYFLHPTMKTTSRLSEPGGNIDYERLETEVFNCLKDIEIQSNYFNCHTNELEYRKAVIKPSIIIVEGVYALHPRFQRYYDYKVFLDIDRTTQFKRILDRCGKVLLERFKSEWIPLEDKYFDKYKLKNTVDLYINNYF